MDVLLQILSHNTRYLRSQLKMTQENLAEASGLSVNEIGKIERERVSPKLAVLEKLSVGFDREAFHLLDPRLDSHAALPVQGVVAKAAIRELLELSEADQQIVWDLIRSLRRNGQSRWKER